jgi:hypothetical protein
MQIKEGILENYAEMYRKYEEQKHLIPEGHPVEIKYEDFIQKPMEHIEHIYRELDLEGFEEARPFMQEHVESQRSYRPNKHKIGKNIVGSVNREWSHIVEMLGYEKMDEAEAPDESSVIIPES